ncbi:MAG: hypothetical protein IAF58_11350, partial [Leptolyngbya sp.]|nr:hypothetical protein [Candidatus Melainabacteria bacterium]
NSKKDGYSFELPIDWKTKPDAVFNLFAAPAKALQELAVQPNIKVVVRPIRPGMSLDELCELSQKQWNGQWKVQSDKRVSVGQADTRRLVLSQDLQKMIESDPDAAKDAQTKVLKSFAIAGDNYYVISCSDTPQNFAKSEKLFNRVLDSVKFVKPTF